MPAFSDAVDSGVSGRRLRSTGACCGGPGFMQVQCPLGNHDDYEH